MFSKERKNKLKLLIKMLQMTDPLAKCVFFVYQMTDPLAKCVFFV